MKHFYSLLRIHYGILFFAIFVSLIMFLPQLRLQNYTGNSYNGVFYTASDSEIFYDARIRDVYDGNYKLSNAFISEDKDLPYILPPLPEISAATLGRIAFFVSDSEKVLFATRLFFPFLLALIIYIFFYQLTCSRLYSILAAATVIFGLDFLQNFRTVWDFLFGRFVDHTPLDFSRPVSPQTGVLFFFVFLAVFWKWLNSEKRFFLILSGIILGLSFYVYFFTWAYIFAATGLFAIYFIFRKSYAKFCNLAILCVTALVIAIPYFINLWKFFQQPDHAYLTFYQGQVFSRQFIMNWTVVTGLVLLFFVKPKGLLRPWLLCLLAGGFLALNQQVITGRELQYGHFHWYFIGPLVGLIALLVLHNRLGKKFIGSAAAVVLLVFLSFHALAKQNNSYEYYKDSYVGLQYYGVLYDWLNDNTQRNSVVLVPDLYRADSLAFYTHNDLFYANFMFLSNTPRQRSQEMFFLYLYLSGISADSAEALFRSNEWYINELLGSLPVRKTYGCLTCLPDSEYERYTTLYRDFVSQRPDKTLDKYNLDYLVLDKKNDPTPPEDILSRFRLEKDLGEFLVYKKLDE